MLFPDPAYFDEFPFASTGALVNAVLGEGDSFATWNYSTDPGRREAGTGEKDGTKADQRHQ